MKKLFFALCFFAPLFAAAHPGHDGGHDGGYTIIHFLTTPVHAIPIYTVLAFFVFLLWRHERAGKALKG